MSSNNHLGYQHELQIFFLDLKGLILFDIDGVIRDVSSSYRLAIKKTVSHFCSWEPDFQDIDNLKSEGIWNNDWDASLELIKRHIRKANLSIEFPSKIRVIEIFNDFYFGGDPHGDPSKWHGLIKNETLLVDQNFFEKLTKKNIGWGFVSGAESSSAKFVLKNQLGLKEAPLIAMEDAPEKPDPTGLIKLSEKLLSKSLGSKRPPIGYIGDTVADVKTIQKAREEIPNQKFFSFAIAPPHLHREENKSKRRQYEKKLKEAGADRVINSIQEIVKCIDLYQTIL